MKAADAWMRCKYNCENCAKHGYPDREVNGDYTHRFASWPDRPCYADRPDMDMALKHKVSDE
jgi:hypothetical protein